MANSFSLDIESELTTAQISEFVEAIDVSESTLSVGLVAGTTEYVCHRPDGGITFVSEVGDHAKRPPPPRFGFWTSTSVYTYARVESRAEDMLSIFDVAGIVATLSEESRGYIEYVGHPQLVWDRNVVIVNINGAVWEAGAEKFANTGLDVVTVPLDGDAGYPVFD